MSLKVFMQPTGRMYKGLVAQHPGDAWIPFVSAGLEAVLQEDKTMGQEEVDAAIAALKLQPPVVEVVAAPVVEVVVAAPEVVIDPVPAASPETPELSASEKAAAALAALKGKKNAKGK